MNRDTLPGTNSHACTSMLAEDIADRIAIAGPGELDGIIKDMWVDHTHGLLADNVAHDNQGETAATIRMRLRRNCRR